MSFKCRVWGNGAPQLKEGQYFGYSVELNEERLPIKITFPIKDCHFIFDLEIEDKQVQNIQWLSMIFREIAIALEGEKIGFTKIEEIRDYDNQSSK